jgi:stearoyl-CoA desaturase (delta-9 desaturase)
MARFDKVQWFRVTLFFLLHVACLLVLIAGWSPVAVVVAIGVYFAWVFPIIALHHVTFGINSLAHTYDTRRYDTGDDSRNNFWLAIMTFGEGWHNNHHYYPNSARQGFRWWEIDISYSLLVVVSWLGLVWDLKPVPVRVLAAPMPPPRTRS